MPRAYRVPGGLTLPCPRSWRQKRGHGADDDDVISDGGSSANEYAEGLGCADRKRCREKATSGFEFHNNPREEYFEEPKSYKAAAESESEPELEEWQERKKMRGDDGRGLGKTLSLLEQREAAEEDKEEADLLERKNRRLEAMRRRCELRKCRRGTGGALPSAVLHAGRPRPVVPSPAAKAAFQARHMQASATKPPQQKSELGARPNVEVARAAPAPSIYVPEDPKACCAALVSLRSRAESGAVISADSAQATAIILYLSDYEMNARLLQSTGLGLELNRAGWTRHAVPKIAKLSVDLVAKWRSGVRAERLSKEMGQRGANADVSRAAPAA